MDQDFARMYSVVNGILGFVRGAGQEMEIGEVERRLLGMVMEIGREALIEFLEAKGRGYQGREIVNAHGAPYVASASIGYPFDYMEKVIKASSIEGPTYIHLHATCPTGWGVDSKYTVEVARLAVQCGLVVLREIENGVSRVTMVPKETVDVVDYLKYQRRFRHIKDDAEAIDKFRSYAKDQLARNRITAENPSVD